MIHLTTAQDGLEAASSPHFNPTASLLQRMPWDVIKHVLRYTRVPDMIALTNTCRQLHELTSDVSIQYAIESHFACAVELTDDYVTGNIDALAQTTLPERLSLLRNLESTWRDLPLKQETIDIPFETSEFHGLSGGVLELGEAFTGGGGATSALRYAILPGIWTPRNIQWKRLDLGSDISSTAISLYENDLIGAITLSPDPGDPTMVIIEIYLIQLSTGLAHPLASRPRLTGPRSSRFIAHEMRSKILGDYLALVVSYVGSNDTDDRFLLFNWLSGELLLDHSAAASGVYRGVAFLSPTILVIIDTSESASLNLWSIVPSPRLLGSLMFPPLLPGYAYDMCDLQDEPCLYTQHSLTAPLYPSVRYSPQEAIVTLLAFLGTSKALFVARRSKLLEIAERLSQPELNRETPLIEYSDWGPHATRWIQANTFATDSPMRHGGQRIAVIHEDAPILGSKIIVYDFNPFHLKKWKEQCSDNGLIGSSSPQAEPNQHSEKLRLSIHRTSQTPSPHLPFCLPLVDELPYITYETEELFQYSAIWTDGERIAGIKMNQWYQATSLDILLSC